MFFTTGLLIYVVAMPEECPNRDWIDDLQMDHTEIRWDYESTDEDEAGDPQE